MIRRFGPLLLLLVPVAAALAAYAALGDEPWRLEAVLARRDALRQAADAYPVTTVLLFTAVHFAVISSALPVGPPMTLIAGFLFGRWLGTGIVLVSATAGALVVYALARMAADTPLGTRMRTRAGPAYEAAAAELKASAFGYLLVMRLVPVFPFFLVNIVAGLAGTGVRPFLAATLIGRVPAALLFVNLGTELGRARSAADLASPGIFLALTGLGLLALGPVLVLRWRRRRTRRAGGPGDRRM